MARIEMPIEKSYVENWGTSEGLRELIQNMQDGQIEHGATGAVNATKNGTLVISNEGVTLPRETLLFGFSTKKKRDEMAGQFGEGMKLGCLALVRAGLNVTIKNGSEQWTPVVVRSEKFAADVLAFDIKKRNAKTGLNDFVVEVKDFGYERWHSDEKKKYINICPPVEMIPTTDGDLIMDKEYKGMVFVKGILVERQNLKHGINFKHVDVDRDRKMVNGFDLKWHYARILDEAITKHTPHKKRLQDDIFESLEQGTTETQFLRSHINEENLDHLVKRFKEKYGPDAFPVSNLSESKELECLGIKGVIVPEQFRDVLAKQMGRFDDLKDRLQAEQTIQHSWHELNPEEKDNLMAVLDMLASAECTVTLDGVQIVTFSSSNTRGTNKDGIYQISRSELIDRAGLLFTLAHEACHDEHGDHGHRHHSAVGSLLAEVAVNCAA